MLHENVRTIQVSQAIDPIKLGECFNLDHMPVSIIKDGIDYDFEDFINMLIDKKLAERLNDTNPCNNCQEFDCTYCEYNHR